MKTLAAPFSTPVISVPEQMVSAPENEVSSRRPVRRGEPCPRCGVGVLDYNGMIDLECPVCGFTEGPGGGCT